MNFFSELKRRNVYKVAVAYAVVGWLVVQIATQTFPFFDVPNWAVRLVILLVAIGFPIALVIAWAFELTPEGLKRTESADAETERRRSSRAWMYVVVAGIFLSAGLFFLGRYTAGSTSREEAGRRSAAPLPEKSVAVLPFENLSEDKANSYFVDGMQDEVITRLAKIAELRVISRTSTLRYKARGNGLAEIARELGVSHLVEGTVQRVGDRIRINVQLIRAENEGHLWAEIYDRNLTDIFAVQTELATAIARELQTKLTGSEQKAVAEKPTSNLAAYDAYLRGIDFASRPGQNPADERKAAEAFEEATRLDPQFAQAWARLSQTSSSLYFLSFDATAARQEIARAAAEKATQLSPASAETMLANAYYRYHVQHDYAGARDLFEKIRDELPSNSEAAEALARIARRQTRWNDAIRLFEEAEKLNPRDAHLFMDRAWTFSMIRNYAGTLQMIERAEAITTHDADVLESKAAYFQWTGDLKTARSLIERIKDRPRRIDVEASQLVLERRYAEAARVLEEDLSKTKDADPVARASTLEWLGSVRLQAGDREGATKAFLEAKPQLEKFRGEQPRNFWIPLSLASVEAGLGNKDAAENALKRALEAGAASDDPVFAPGVEEGVARIEAQMGKADSAIDRIERLLPLPYGAFPITQAKLRIDPAWDPLRTHPRFKAIVDGPEPKTVYH
ncbi:MAG TPA: tetratricopeptide repeat protein [Chthoniobacterales bacterium]|nr:tetratricopeptide repeat protein [Chthoniobacterales bacterium]